MHRQDELKDFHIHHHNAELKRVKQTTLLCYNGLLTYDQSYIFCKYVNALSKCKLLQYLTIITNSLNSVFKWRYPCGWMP